MDTEDERPDDTGEKPQTLHLVRTIGKTTYKVVAHFSATSTETMADKIKRLLRNEVEKNE